MMMSILKLIEIGGRELVMQKDRDGSTTLVSACAKNISFDVIIKLIEIGG